MPQNNVWLRQQILCRLCCSLQNKRFKRTLGLKTHARLGGQPGVSEPQFLPLSRGPMMPDLGKAPSGRATATGYRKELAAMHRQRVPGRSPQSAVEGAWLTQPHTVSRRSHRPTCFPEQEEDSGVSCPGKKAALADPPALGKVTFR